ncbi:MAG: cysteate synthase [Oculatellaceae cyanobacterium bins.114]|nr:cysteate synthase [Oculatellaceae cyanobacterium bins.114]
MLCNYQQPLHESKYVLRCVLCGAEYLPDPFRLTCSAEHRPSLLQSVYANHTLEIHRDLPGLFQFIDWLPVERSLNVIGKPITYTSKKLAHHLGLDHLFISFNGYWAERDAHFLSCSFKELEAATVLARVPQGHERTLVIASAGNAGRAFANICSAEQIPLCLVVPESSLSAIWLMEELPSSVFLVAVGEGGDYSDAIALSRLISQMEGFFPEGGVTNVARRDGMGLTVLDAAVTLGRIPDHYFQAVGSGTGGIAAWEANLRLLADGRFGTGKMKLHLSQSLLFCPMVDAWKAGNTEISWIDESTAKEQISQVSAQVLTNRQPAYAVAGGVYEALVDTHGEMYSVSNQESAAARVLFEQLEGIDVCPAAGVAIASLMQAVNSGTVEKQDHILLNITSGGSQRMHQDYSLQQLQPNVVFSPHEIVPEIVAERIEKQYPHVVLQK